MIINNISLPFFLVEKKIICSLSIVNSNAIELSWLSNQELDRYHKISSEKRKLNYVLGRTAAKHAIISQEPKYHPQKINIINSNNGNPLVECCDYFVSISHSKNYAVGLAFKDPAFAFGIDIEHIDTNRLLALKYITNDDEPTTLNEKDLTIAWAMKESLSKTLLCGFSIPFEDFSIKQISLYDDIYVADYKHHPEYKSVAGLLNDFALAITYDARLIVDSKQIKGLYCMSFPKERWPSG